MNKELENNPGLVNQDCYDAGWFFEIEMTSVAEWDSLFASSAYENHLKQEAK